MKQLSKSSLLASTTAQASLNVPPGTAPFSPVDGDIWVEGDVLKLQATSTRAVATLDKVIASTTNGDWKRIVSMEYNPITGATRIVYEE